MKGRAAFWLGRHRWLAGTLALILAVAALVVVVDTSARWSSRGRLFDSVAEVPAMKVGLVLGTTDRVNGRENLFFRYRIDAAVELWNAGKIRVILVSGDNRTRYYNEPQKMRQALMARGVPGDRIVCDYAGLRTLDSVVRAKEVFGADSLVFISQRFQNERAVYLADAHGMRTVGYNARDVATAAGAKTRLREVGARFKMWLDVHFLNTRPRHLGEREPLPE